MAPRPPSMAIGPVDLSRRLPRGGGAPGRSPRAGAGRAGRQAAPGPRAAGRDANRRDEAAARARRMSAHLVDCDGCWSGPASSPTPPRRPAARSMPAGPTSRPPESKLALVDEQRDAASQMIDDAPGNWPSWRPPSWTRPRWRELEAANATLRDAQEAHAEATETLRAVEQEAANRAAMRDHILFTRADLVARIEAPMADTEPVRNALAAFDAESQTGEPDLVARELAREWIEVDGELERITDALPAPPSADELASAERRLAQIEQTIADLESASRQSHLVPRRPRRDRGRPTRPCSPPRRTSTSRAAPRTTWSGSTRREVEPRSCAGTATRPTSRRDPHRPRARGRRPGRPARRPSAARRVAEDTLASLGPPPSRPPSSPRCAPAATGSTARPPTCWAATRPVNVAELLYAQHRGYPPNRTRAPGHRAGQLRDPAGGGRCEAAVSWLIEQDQDLNERDECRRRRSIGSTAHLGSWTRTGRAFEYADQLRARCQRRPPAWAGPCTGCGSWRTSCPTWPPRTSAACSA